MEHAGKKPVNQADACFSDICHKKSRVSHAVSRRQSRIGTQGAWPRFGRAQCNFSENIHILGTEILSKCGIQIHGNMVSNEHGLVEEDAARGDTL